MKMAFITPTKYLERYSKQGDFYLALAHLIDDNGKNEYASFHRREAEQGKRVILDNGLFEGSQVDAETLIRRARLIKASTVCAPDVLYDSKGTIKEFKRFIKLKQEEGLVCEVMGIPQADNPAEWWDCFQFMDLHSECNLIGLSILSIPECFDFLAGQQRNTGYITGARMYLIRQLFAYSDLSGHRITPCHLLGIGESYGDIKMAKDLLGRDIVSNDSSSAFVHGTHCVRYTPQGSIPGGKILNKLDFNLDFIHPDAEKVIQHNITTAKRIAS